MIETIAAIFGGSLATYVFIKSRKKDNGMTIKSDSDVRSDKGGGYTGRPNGGYQPTNLNLHNQPNNPPKDETIETINMNGITGIVVEGSPTLKLTDDKISVSENSNVETKFNKLIVTPKDSNNSKIIIGNNVLINSNVRIDDVSNDQLEEVQLKNFDPTIIKTFKITGSGDLIVKGLHTASSVDAKVQGSGDLVLDGISVETLKLSIQGSGDITLGKKTSAKNVNVSIQGSGDINIRTKSIGVLSKSIQGSGDINII